MPRAGGPQQKLAHKQVFFKIDIQSAYWQFPMSETSMDRNLTVLGQVMVSGHFSALPTSVDASFRSLLTSNSHSLTSRIGVTFEWQDERQHAFEALKQSLMIPPVLNNLRRTGTFVLMTDASDTGIGAVLTT